MNSNASVLFLFVAATTCAPVDTGARFTVTEVPPPVPGVQNLPGVEGGQAPLGFVEIQGLSAGAFDPVLWQGNRLHWVPDVRMPILAPRMGGVFRNIYAPSAVEHGDGWLFFYSAWDGIETGTDRVYSATTADFIDFDHRRTVIHNGAFVHVSNVNVQKAEDGSLHMVATCWPDPNRRDKPIYFRSLDGEHWNGSPAPYHAQLSDVIAIHGYPQYDNAELNGANVLLYDRGKFLLYFTNWHDRGKLYWSQGRTPSNFEFRGLALETEHAVNDVKKFTAGGRDWYVMALHKKGDVGLPVKDCDKLWFSLSNDGRTFGPERLMIKAREEIDRYIFAVGFVARADRILGVLYGGGPTVECNRNQIFGYWLQKRVVLTANPAGRGAEYESQGALGPDRQWLKLPPGPIFEGTLTVLAEDGTTPIGTQPVKLRSGGVYRVVWR